MNIYGGEIDTYWGPLPRHNPYIPRVLTGVVVPEVGAVAQVALPAVHVEAAAVQRGGVAVARRARARRAHLLPRLRLCALQYIQYVNLHF